MSITSNKVPPKTTILKTLSYNPDTGEFTHKRTYGGAKEGQVAGSVNAQGYIRISIDGRYYLAHRVAYFLTTGKQPGKLMIDHINRIRTDNRASNLRAVTHRQNQTNVTKKGFHFCNTRKKWRATIAVGGKQKCLGYHSCPLLARLAYLDAAKQYGRGIAS